VLLRIRDRLVTTGRGRLMLSRWPLSRVPHWGVCFADMVVVQRQPSSDFAQCVAPQRAPGSACIR
jgi:hypothetical protein